MIERFGEWTWVFLLFIGSVLAVLAWSSWRVRPWAWPMTVIVYGIGVLGRLWQVSQGIPRGWVAAAVNGAVVVYAVRPTVRRAYRVAECLSGQRWCRSTGRLPLLTETAPGFYRPVFRAGGEMMKSKPRLHPLFPQEMQIDRL
jgi:hypothetical protein